MFYMTALRFIIRNANITFANERKEWTVFKLYYIRMVVKMDLNIL